jgi:uncharacterized protein YjbI with pentapeptide repeats
MGRFFTINPREVPRRIAQDFDSIVLHAGQDVSAVEKVFGSCKIFVPFYVSPDGQNVNPADTAEENTGLVSRAPIFQMLDQFLGGDNRTSHAFILSDAGMGKTSLLMILKLAHTSQLVIPTFAVVLLKLGERSLSRIADIPDPTRTILLLDALDEDSGAWTNFYTRVQELLRVTQHFLKVVITCRTQFFPWKHEKDGLVPGVIKLHEFSCAKVFLSPFDDDQVNEYLARRFANEEMRQRAGRIVMRMKSLKFRPMLLSYVDLLVDKEKAYDNVFELYEELTDAWLAREVRKGIISEEDKEILLKACESIAFDMYDSQERTIPAEKIQAMCQSEKRLRQLEDMSVEGRSLLHRTSEGTYKFAHHTMLEYFVARVLAQTNQKLRATDQIKSFLLDLVGSGRLRRLRNLDLSDMVLRGLRIRNVGAQGADLTRALILDCDFSNGIFDGACLLGARIEQSSFHNVRFSGATITGCRFSASRLGGAKFAGVSFKDVYGSKLDFTGEVIDDADLSGVTLEECAFSNTKLRRVRLETGTFLQCNFSGTGFEECILANARYDGSRFAACRAKDAQFSFASFINCAFSRAEAEGACFVRAVLTGASFADATLVRCKF